MSPLQKAIAFVGLGLIAAGVAGCLARHRYAAWCFFSIYLAAVLVLEALPHAAPDRFFTPDFWQVKETAYAALRFGMACEVGLRVLRNFPGAFATARRLVLLVLTVTLGAVIFAPRGDYPVFLGEVVPRVLNGSVWMLMAIGAVILWYRIPVQSFHKAILLSYIPYLLVFTVVAKQLAAAAFHSAAMQYLNQLAYVALLAYWNYVIWRSDPGAALPHRPGAAGGAA
jgi:hypothetical protein